MKKTALLLCCIALFNFAFAQSYSPNFLDGRVMLKLKNEVKTNANELNRIDEHSFSLEENLANYPILKEALDGFGVTKFERPSYYTGKKELVKIYRITFSNFAKIDEMVDKLAELGIVEFAEKEPIYKTGFVPNDTFHTGTNKWYHDLVGAEDAWNISLGSNSVKVAIVDNAVFAGHSDLTAYLQRDVSDNDNDATPPQDYSTDSGWSHGTHCAGLATADINNATGIASLGGDVEVIGIKATPNSGISGSIYDSYDGVQWACQNGANVVSMSFGSPSQSGAFQTLVNAYPGVVFMAAAGNDGVTTLQYPAAYANVICVGSVDGNDTRSSFSNYNGSTPWVDICSPGGFTSGGLLSTVYTTSGNNYAKMGGTSMATPYAAGLVGLMLSINPAMTPSAIEACLISSGVNNGQNMGPRIDALAALQCVQATVNGDPIPAFSGIPLSITEGQTVTFTDFSSDGGNPISNWTWSFPGGTPNSFTGQTPPAITYTTAGVYDVTLTVTNSQNTVPLTKTNYINVSLVPYGNWIIQNSGFPAASRGINHISIVNSQVVWATAYDGSTATPPNVRQFTKTNDGGSTWTPGTANLGSTALEISMISAVDANTAWLAAYPTAAATGGIWKTTNGGTSWTRQNTALFNNAASFTNVVHFWDANEGFCQGDPIGAGNGEFELYRTTNGGSTWTAISGANIPNPLAGEYGYTRQIEVVGNTVWFTTNRGRIYHSTDKGMTWAVYQSPLTDFGSAAQSGNLSFKDGNTGLIIDNSSVVYESTNSGATWSTVTTTGTVLTSGLCYVEGTNTVFSTGAGSSYSQDGGTTWNIIDTDQHLYVEFANPSTGWSGWFNNATNPAIEGMWKWNNTSGALTAGFQGTPSIICTGSTVQFNDQSTGGTPTSWSWTFTGGTPATSTQQNPLITYNTFGTYAVSLTVDDGNGPTNFTDNTHVIVEAPAVQPSVITGATSPCEFDVETYSVTNVNSVSYTWILPATWTGNSTTNLISATVGSAGGNIEVSAVNVCGPSTPRVLAVTMCTITSIDEVDANGINIFPNPAQDIINISGVFDNANIEDKNIKVIDVLGKIVISSVINKTNFNMDVSQLNKGVYFIQLNNGSITHKFIKK
jgi:PKD repeat protein